MSKQTLSNGLVFCLQKRSQQDMGVIRLNPYFYDTYLLSNICLDIVH